MAEHPARQAAYDKEFASIVAELVMTDSEIASLAGIFVPPAPRRRHPLTTVLVAAAAVAVACALDALTHRP